MTAHRTLLIGVVGIWIGTGCEDESLFVEASSAALEGEVTVNPDQGFGETQVFVSEEDAGVPRERAGVDTSTDTDTRSGPSTTTSTTTSTSVSGSATIAFGPGTITVTASGNRTTTTTTTTTTTSTTTDDSMPVAELRDRRFVCKVINGTDNYDPTPNALQTRFNLSGADLGVPLAIGSDLHLFFGDTAGYQTIWPVGEADAVGRVPLASVRNDLSALCRELAVYVTDDDPSVAHADDPTVLRDFAGAFIIAPAGESPARYLALTPAGLPNVPGALEVPAGALRSQNDVYVFYAAGASFDPLPHQTLSFIARWDDRSRPGYQVLYALDELDGGALGGHFIQVAPLPSGDTTYLFGTGFFRRSSIYLARTQNVEDAESYEVYLPGERRWVATGELTQQAREAVQPIVELPGVGELSAFYIRELAMYGLMYQRELHDAEGGISDNRVLVRFADQPEGPWTEPLTLSDMADPAFRAQHCCGISCQGDQILHCDRAGLYGAYALPTLSYADGTLTLPYVVSTWDPYNVVVFEAHIALR